MYTEENFQTNVCSAVKARRPESVIAAIFEGYEQLGEDRCAQILVECIQLNTSWELNLGDICFYWETLNEEMERSGAEVTLSDVAKDTTFKYFTELGLVLGEDFSFEDKGVYISDRAMDVVEQNMPEEAFEFLKAASVTKQWSLPGIEENVGVPGYFGRMIEVVKDRMDMYCEVSDWKSASDYLWYLLEGTIKKFPMLEEDDNEFSAYLFKATVAPQYQDAVLDYACSGQRKDLDDRALEAVMEDIISAVGTSNPLGLPAVEVDGKLVKGLTKNDLRALNQVWENVGDIPLRELIAELESIDVRNKRRNP
jgi:hypothetical protein